MLTEQKRRCVFDVFVLIFHLSQFHKGTIQDSVSGSSLFNIFLNDLEIEHNLILFYLNMHMILH